MDLLLETGCEDEINIMSNLRSIPGLWIDGMTYWLTNGTEKLCMEQNLTLKMKERQLYSNVVLVDIHVRNHSNVRQKCKILYAHQFRNISKHQFAFLSPVDNVVFHADKENICLINSHCYGEQAAQFSVQPLWNFQSNNIWSDVCAGILSYQPLSKGPSISLLLQDIELLPNETTTCTCWIVTGTCTERLLSLNNQLKKTY